MVGDKNAIFISHVLAYGKDYKIKFKDPSNNEDVEDTDLTQLQAREFDFDNCERGVMLTTNFHIAKEKSIETFNSCR